MYCLRPEITPPERIEDLLAGRFRFLGSTRQFAAQPRWNDRGPQGPSHLWRMNLHYHRFLVDAAAAAIREPTRARVVLDRAAELLEDWRMACPPASREGWADAWSGYAVSTRLLNAWTARRLLERADAETATPLCRRLDALAAASAAFLADWLERDLGGNHLFRNACALVAAGSWFAGPEAEAWRVAGSRLLAREIESQILPDGLHEERSPMYHALVLEDLLLAAPGIGASAIGPHGVTAALPSMLAALRMVTHPDGEIALFNDSTFGIAPPPLSLLSLAGEHGAMPASGTAPDLAAAGYFRLGENPAFILFDAGALGPDHLPAHAHCDALSFEMSWGGRRIVTDTGVDRYEAGPERQFQRSTKAHSTLQVGGLEQGEPFGSFRMGRRPKVRGRRIDDRTVEGEHDGFGRAGVHHRRLQWNPPGQLTWVDRVDGPQEVEVTVRVGLAPEASAAIESGRAIVMAPPTGRFELQPPPQGGLSMEAGDYCEGFGRSRPRVVLCWRGRAGRAVPLPFRLSIRD